MGFRGELGAAALVPAGQVMYTGCRPSEEGVPAPGSHSAAMEAAGGPGCGQGCGCRAGITPPTLHREFLVCPRVFRTLSSRGEDRACGFLLPAFLPCSLLLDPPWQTPSRVRARSLNVWENALMWAASVSWGRVLGAAVVLPLAPTVRPLSCAPGEASTKDSIGGAAGLSGLAGGAPSPITEGGRRCRRPR